ncbi:D-alanyl-D-alanine carboxypeptidase [Halomonas sp. CnH100-B]|uniref:serine-type D-Ala-D-Ala carboxypeptidase n=1 Tax=Vreelandella aquamarina TaxID=77097 RepID=A0A857GK46_9GAMM|nr:MULTISPECIES: D-alanyl-D-alanine carboxypeptidase family protein [Halomonas]HBM28602.1 serine-type D-Ala-D-Ala carboxypeptidase [Halomonas sp.]MCO7230128.1 D-alanyl-D-alanine carboxypeptidase [Halomonas sp. CnH100-B]MDK9688894.1 D-alanyl-D-alanine carboxypeptidase family protein [Halomonas sp. LC1]MDP4558152.1 D-alanyl-D-alanine carboxypeptidase family protein [Halomonas meridiana]QHD49585.1 serine-type D-Ala-D-Ala carboxypeptidase [Halomonas meridiana]|tara:strand:- start:2201 stop:3400 length:1200 start_codon:yes stop_codon:yes gene_type:complete
MNVLMSIRRTAKLCLFAAMTAVISPAMAQVIPQPQTIIPAPPQLAASSWILMDANSGRILAEHNSDERLPPASLTKLMTAYLVERELDRGTINLTDMVNISENAWRTGGSKMFIEVGDRVSVDNLLHGIIIVSGNDASVAMAEHLAGGEAPFADLMNQHATRLGMNDTNFMNATGLPHENHYSTAHDMARLSRHIINDYPEHYAIYSQRNFSFGGIDQPNRNRLLWRDPSVDGLKTGWTTEAGYCLVSSAQRDGMRLISVVMGTNSDEARAQESQKLLSYGFRFYETMKLYERGAVLATPRVWGGDINELRVGVDEEVFMTLPRNRNEELRARLNLDADIHAPVAVGDDVGTLEVYLGEEMVGERQLVALENIEEGGLFKRLFDQVQRFFSNLISNFTS